MRDAKIEGDAPAFPVPNLAESGMTLRDYFAARVMTQVKWDDHYFEACARRCYEKADAMLKVRKEKP